MTSLQVGIQSHLPTYKALPIPELVELGKRAYSAGVTQLWVTDNLQSRNAFVVLAALAASLPVDLGTAVTVQYFRNPVDVADAVAAISEIGSRREISVGLARGNASTPNYINTIKPISTLRETAACLSQLLAGEEVSFGDYPTLAAYFNFNPRASFQLNFAPKVPIHLFCGGNGPSSLQVGGRFMDGLIFGGEFKAVAGTGRLPSLLSTFDDAALEAGKVEKLPKVAEIKLSVSRNRRVAREFAHHTSGRRILNLHRRGYTDEEIMKLGVSSEEVQRLDAADRDESSPQSFLESVTDAMIDGVFVAGEPGECIETMIELQRVAQDHGFGQLMFSELGPDVEESLHLLCDEILPAL